MIQLKICGNTYPKNTKLISSLSPNYMGFIFYASSERSMKNTMDEKILGSISKSINKVGVFVDESTTAIIDIHNKYDLQYVQLHGRESTLECKILKQQKIKIIKVFHINHASDFGQCAAYTPYCDYFLFDTYTPKYGGSGESFNWSLLDKYKENTPFFLAGGIGLENIENALSIHHPMLHALDINSKIEISPGIKDGKKIKKIKKKIYENNILTR